MKRKRNNDDEIEIIMEKKEKNITIVTSVMKYIKDPAVAKLINIACEAWDLIILHVVVIYH